MPLFTPVERQIFAQEKAVRGKLDRVSPVKDRRDDIGGEECEAKNAGHVGCRKAFSRSDLLDRLCVTVLEPLEPVMGPGERLDEGDIRILADASISQENI